MEKTTGDIKSIKRIVLIGPESTGKSELAIKLAHHYNTIYISEYAREFVEMNNYKYSFNDVLHIAKKQIEQEEDYLYKANNLIFIDTDIILTKIWLLHVYKKYPEWIDDEIRNLKRDLYLLCYYDLTWQFDKARENEDLREYLYNLYEDEIKRNGFNYKVIKGIGDKRLENAVEAINSSF